MTPHPRSMTTKPATHKENKRHMSAHRPLIALGMILLAGLLALLIAGPAGAAALLGGTADVLRPW